MQIQLLLQSLILPLLLSLVVYRTTSQKPRWQATGGFFAWLLAYFWILNLPNLPPAEAIDWLWLAGISFIAIQFLPSRHQPVSQLLLFLLSLLLISWPLLQYALSPVLIIELLLILLTAAMLLMSKQSSPAPALIISMSATALAISTALVGSLLIAQLLTALAAAIGVFSLLELKQQWTQPRSVSRLKTSNIMPQALLYLLLLAIARFYADLPVGVALLFLFAALSLRLNKRIAIGLCLLSISAATTWIFVLQGRNSYY